MKSKKRDGKKLRKAIRKQLQYLRRDIGYIVKLVQGQGLRMNIQIAQ